MAQRSDIPSLTEAETVHTDKILEQQNRVPMTRSWGAFLLATVEAACLFVVTAGRSGILLSSITTSITGWLAFVHRDAFRIPALLLASAGSMLNLHILWRAHRLRNAPAAAWRKKQLTRRDRWRIGIVLSLSVLTLLTAAGEVYFHRLLRHTIL